MPRPLFEARHLELFAMMLSDLSPAIRAVVLERFLRTLAFPGEVRIKGKLYPITSPQFDPERFTEAAHGLRPHREG